MALVAVGLTHRPCDGSSIATPSSWSFGFASSWAAISDRTVREHDEVRAQCLKRPFALLQSRPRVRRKIGALE